MIRKHYLEKVFATRFPNVGKPYKPNENKVWRVSISAIKNPYKTCLKMMDFEPKPQKGLKMIEKHYLEKVFATRFQNVRNPYKTNGKQGFPNVIFACAKPL